MTIGIDARFWSESGVGRYIRNLLVHLTKIDKDNDYVLFIRSQDIDTAKKKLGSSFRFVPADIPWHSVKEQLSFPALLKHERLDLVHFPYFSLPILYDRPYVVTIHDLILHHYTTGEASTLPFFIYAGKLAGYKFIMQQSARKAESILTVSESTRDEIIDHLRVREGKVHVTYEGVDSSLQQPTDEKPLVAGDYFLHVGNVYPHKNMAKTLSAFQIFVQQRKRGKLVLVGKEDYFFSKLVVKIRDLDLGGHTIFLGNVSDAQLVNLYKNADALLAPSLMEGFDLPTVEAMAHGCLTLVSDIAVHREIVRDAGIYFDPFDINDIFVKMLTVYEGEKAKLQNKVRLGRKLAEKYSWEETAKKTLQVYEDSTRL